MMPWKHGALLCDDMYTTRFRVWAPLADKAVLVLPGRDKCTLPMKSVERGYFELLVSDCPVDTRYLFQIDDNPPRPDPASRQQPEGVHKGSAVTDCRFEWTDGGWAGLPLEEYVIYELHIGTFTSEGTFDSAIKELSRLQEFGITAVEVMPIAQFPGDRNWGYDGVYPYAAQYSYGGLRGFQRFIDAAHRHGIAVILDVVYNHLGPEGNYLPIFGPYFTPNYHTPWGDSLNFDGPFSDGVRDFFLGNALFWIEECHVDALRLDAVHAIIDNSAIPFLRQLTETVHQAGRRLHKRVHVTGENDRNDPRFTVVRELGGIGADSQWSDDFHHALHTVLTGESFAYYKDFGKVSQLAKAYTDGFVYDGCYSMHRRRNHGADSRAQDGIRYIVCSQNHDQIGNRATGDRLSMLLDFSQTKLAAVALLTAPYLPLIFMGEETGAQSPFMYFVSHDEPSLIDAVRKGRAAEFHEFFTHDDGPDPQSEETFFQSKLRQNQTIEGTMINMLYRDLLNMRKLVPALRPLNKRQTSALPNNLRRTLVVWRDAEEGEVMIFFNFAKESNVIQVAANPGSWKVLLNTETTMYGGVGIDSGTGMESAGELVMELPASSAIILQHCTLPAYLGLNIELKKGL